jgi:hypothetical protein
MLREAHAGTPPPPRGLRWMNRLLLLLLALPALAQGTSTTVGDPV